MKLKINLRPIVLFIASLALVLSLGGCKKDFKNMSSTPALSEVKASKKDNQQIYFNAKVISTGLKPDGRVDKIINHGICGALAPLIPSYTTDEFPDQFCISTGAHTEKKWDFDKKEIEVLLTTAPLKKGTYNFSAFAKNETGYTAYGPVSSITIP